MIKISFHHRELNGEVNLPSSKSISNRLLILRSLCDKQFEITNISSANDTLLMESLLKKIEDHKDTNSEEPLGLDAKNAGTVYRFLTAYLSVNSGKYIFTGDERMKQRPVGELVNALNKLGADIEYLEKKGYPPLKISGNTLKGGEAEIDASVSSQFISALLMIAPLMKQPLNLHLKGNINSAPYIQMTINLMQAMGVDVEWRKRSIYVNAGSYVAKDIIVEPDWSSASYWYLMAAFSDEVDLLLKGLTADSLQGDSVVAEIFEKSGVRSQYSEEGVRLTKQGDKTENFEFDFTACPDLAQTVAVCCAGLNIPATLSGLKSLKIKEADRLAALKNELGKLGYNVTKKNNELIIQPLVEKIQLQSMPINTYSDHRMAMAFAPLAILRAGIIIDDPEVVKKSYPSFWDDLRKVGFRITPLAEVKRR